MSNELEILQEESNKFISDLNVLVEKAEKAKQDSNYVLFHQVQASITNRCISHLQNIGTEISDEFTVKASLSVLDSMKTWFYKSLKKYLKLP